MWKIHPFAAARPRAVAHAACYVRQKFSINTGSDGKKKTVTSVHDPLETRELRRGVKQRHNNTKPAAKAVQYCRRTTHSNRGHLKFSGYGG